MVRLPTLFTLILITFFSHIVSAKEIERYLCSACLTQSDAELIAKQHANQMTCS